MQTPYVTFAEIYIINNGTEGSKVAYEQTYSDNTLVRVLESRDGTTIAECSSRGNAVPWSAIGNDTDPDVIAFHKAIIAQVAAFIAAK